MLGLAVTAGCLVAAFWGIDFAQVRTSFAQANYLTLPLLLGLLFVFFWLKAERWRLLLSPLGTFRTRDVVPAMMIGFMGNNILPAHLGEFIRVYVLSRKYNLSKTAVLSTVVLERVFDIVAILLLLGASLVFDPSLPEQYRTLSLYIAGVTLAGVCVLAAYLIWTATFVRLAEWFLARIPLLPEGLRRKVAEMLEAGAIGLASVRQPRVSFWIAVTSLAQWLANGAMVWVSLWSFGIKLSPLASFFVMGVTAFGVTVPSTPGFFGIIQAAFRYSLAVYGVEEADAVAASIYYQMAQYIPVTAIGLYFANRIGLKLGQMEREAEGMNEGKQEGRSTKD